VQADDVLRDADIAMYQAKSWGKARFAIFDAQMRARAVQRLSLESELRDALDRQEFCLNYQPILDLQHRRLSGFEALLRWRHPERGHIPPGDFIPVAEETGLIVPIGQWVLREACCQMAEWQAHFDHQPPFTVSVNLSARQFKQVNLAQQVAEALAATGLSAQCLKLEITESAIMEEAQAAIATLSQLRALGVQVQIDDFGTGYSSLSYLHRFPVDTLKIDRSFIWRMGVDGDNTEIVRTIITLAHELGMSVIAEGLETPEQLERVTRLACEQGQGFLISRPLAVEQVAQFIRGLEADLSLPLVLVNPRRSL
jgi:EAL domain-containing protein (putative c-di-GMP-specific phosphodiesterase class I)